MHNIWVTLVVIVYLNVCLGLSSYCQEQQVDTNIVKDNTDTFPRKEWMSQRYLYGIDISKYRGTESEFYTKNKKNIVFVMFKATEGTEQIDSSFSENLNTCRNRKLLIGAYHLFNCDEDPILQVKHYIKKYNILDKTDLPPIIYLTDESIDSIRNPYEIQMKLFRFLDYMNRKYKRTAIIYTNLNFADKYISDSMFSEYALWICGYKDKSSPEMPKAWKTTLWTFWQKDFNYTFNTTKNNLEFFNGNYLDLQKLIKESRKSK
jgi:GH25 family lysozyme M1 (1,4-beta-N-acetylmuramidase)